MDGETTGGFSSLSVNTIQPWQKDAVESWTKTKGARPSHYNISRRCCPDLSIFDAGYYTVQGGDDQPIGGTSAAAPTLAGMISIINGHLLDQRKPPLGFLNYFLYQNKDSFLDIVRGSNNGYDATVGYDPASGLGTFSVDTFQKLKQAALSVSSSKTIRPTPTPKLLIGLKHSDVARQQLDKEFWRIADPDISDATFLSRDDIANIVAVDESTTQEALRWLRKIGADMSTLRILPTRDAIEVEWQGGRNLERAPAVPKSFSDYVILKHGALAKVDDSRRSTLFDVDSNFGPSEQKQAYGVPSDLKGTNEKNVQMVFGLGTFGYRKEDISLFFSQYSPISSIDDISFDEGNVWKGQTGKNFVEGELDVSYISAFAPGVKTLVANSNISTSTEAGQGYGAGLVCTILF